jgi:hypothetical protein
LSTRPIPKGPGRRPKSLARQRFIELLAQGGPLRAACLEVGVSRSAVAARRPRARTARPRAYSFTQHLEERVCGLPYRPYPAWPVVLMPETFAKAMTASRGPSLSVAAAPG